MSTAPTVEALLDFEGQVQAAVKSVLSAGGLMPHELMDESIKGDRATWIHLQLGDAISAEGPKFVETPSGELEWGAYNATLRIGVITTRDSELTAREIASVRGMHRAWIAKVRKEMMLDVSNPFDETNLPWLSVHWLRPLATQFAVDDDRKTDETTLSWEMKFRIRPEAWPGN